MSTVYPITKPRVKNDSRWEKRVIDLFSHITHSGSPVGNVTPRFVGDKCLDTSNNDWYMAFGTSSSQWESIYVQHGIYYPSDTTSDAITSAASVASSTGGIVQLLDTTYTIDSTIVLPKNVSLVGTHVPNQTNPSDVQDNGGTIFNRTADVKVVTITGENRSTARGGKNLVGGIAFENDADVSTEAIIDAEIADNVIIEKCSFWEDDTSATVGHMIDLEECWDWTFRDCIFKQYGNATKNAVNLYNGASDFTNYIYFQNTKFYNGKGKAIVSDAGGAGSSRNSYIFIQGCKFEDSDNAALSYVSGPLSHVVITDSLFVSGDTRHIDIDSQGGDWRLIGNEFASIGDTPTEYINVDGSQNIKLIGNYFNGIGAATTRFVHIDGTGGGGELRGFTMIGNNFYESSLGTTPMLAMTGTIHESVTVKDNADYQNEAVTTGSPALMTWAGYTRLDSSGGAITATLGSGIKRGDFKTIVMTDATTSSTVSVTNHVTSDPEVGTFSAVDDTWCLMWTGTEWVTIYASCTF